MTARPAINEASLQRQVIDLAHIYRWKVAHFRGTRIQRRDGSVYYATPVQADGAGFPDLILVRGERIVAVELKSARGRLSEDQEIWLGLLERAGCETFTWRPSQWTEIVEILK